MMTFMSALHANEKPLTQPLNLSHFLPRSLLLDTFYGATGHLPVRYTACHLFHRRVGKAINRRSLVYLTLFFCPLFIEKHEAFSTVSHQKKDPILYHTNVLLCASTSSIISDPVILIAYPQTQRGEKN